VNTTRLKRDQTEDANKEGAIRPSLETSEGTIGRGSCSEKYNVVQQESLRDMS